MADPYQDLIDRYLRQSLSERRTTSAATRAPQTQAGLQAQRRLNAPEPRRVARPGGMTLPPRGAPLTGPPRPETHVDPNILAAIRGETSNRTPVERSFGGTTPGGSFGQVGGGGGEIPWWMMDMGGSPDTSGISEAYDAMIDAVLSQLGPMGEAGELATSNIGDYFGYAEAQAQEGQGVVGDIYSEAQAGVGDIYDDLAGRMESLPGEITDIATAAAGQAVAPRVAEQSAVAAAPFAAAGESSRAGALENLTRSSAAAENYMAQLAGAVPAEGAQRQAEVEQRMALAKAQVQQQAAMIEADKQRAIAQYSADPSVDMFSRMLDVMQMELAQDEFQLRRDRHQLEREMFEQSGGMDSAEFLRQLDIGEKTDPTAIGGLRGAEMFLQDSQVSPQGFDLFQSILNESQMGVLRPEGTAKTEREMFADALQMLEGYTTETERPSNFFGFLPWVEQYGDPQPVGDRHLYEGDPRDLDIIRRALRLAYD